MAVSSGWCKAQTCTQRSSTETLQYKSVQPNSEMTPVYAQCYALTASVGLLGEYADRRKLRLC
jgi:hypothetical protein